MNPAPAGPPVPRWTWTHWLAAITIVFALHVTLVFMFGSHKRVVLGPVKHAPSLTLTGESADNLPGLNDATLFALPERSGFSGLMWAPPPLSFHQQDWTEDPHWLAGNNPLAVAELGAAFKYFVQTNHFAKIGFEFNQSPPLSVPVVKPQPVLVQDSALRIDGEIADRPLLNPVKLPSWPNSDVIAPSLVQVLVDAAGNVVSATLLPPLDSWAPSAVRDTVEPSPVRDSNADQRAVEIARNSRFAPLSAHAGSFSSQPLTHLAVGQLIFNWQAVPMTATNGL
ncbi:MAG TPA: hypothetical protein VMH87_10490 [Pseudomonadales bacterium]|nr:hypothetical protein [Pseudomonadales bacterium]